MPKTRGGWKKYERHVAHLAGGSRIPVTGRQGPEGDPGDIWWDGFYCEVRDREKPAPVAYMREIWPAAKVRQLVPVVVFKAPAGLPSPLALLPYRELVEVVTCARRGGYPRYAARGEGGRPRPARRGDEPAAGDRGGGAGAPGPGLPRP